jgi:hypothetical protein
VRQIGFVRFQMADHRVCFTLGSHIRFGSLYFLCMRVDRDLVLLPLHVDRPCIHANLALSPLIVRLAYRACHYPIAVRGSGTSPLRWPIIGLDR